MTDFTLRPLTVPERKYTYAQSSQLQGQTGNIGYLRGDFGSSGDQFYTTWFDTRPQWKSDEYKVANPFVDVGFRQVKDVVDLRVFDLLNISRINNNRAEEMLLCIYHLLQPDSRIDEGIYNDEIDQYFSYREWKKKHQPLSGVTVREILATEDLNEDALLRIFDGVTAAFYKSDEYNSREYRYSNLSELRKAMKHKEGGTNGKAQ